MLTSDFISQGPYTLQLNVVGSIVGSLSETHFLNAIFIFFPFISWVWQNKCEAETTAEESEELLVATELVAQVQPLFAE